MVKLTNLSPTGRKTRRPSHTFQVRQKPWILQPIMIAPVLPGETMKNLLLQSRAVTDPIANPLIGWWLEYYFFYVSHRNLEEQDFLDMMLSPDYDLSAHNAVADTTYYHFGSTIPWLELCTAKVVQHYFRAESDTAAHEIDGMPLVTINNESWLDSVINDADFITPADVDVDNIDANATDNLMASDIDKAMRMWQFQRLHGLTDMDYEDFLATYGVSVPEVQENKPELIRFIREWQYPSNTIDPTTGVPSSAVSWAIRDRADKDRFFREPGFLVGYTVARPKVYLKGQVGAAVGLLDSALSWLPAIMRDDPYTSLKKVDALSGPLSANTDAYWVDLKDIFLYGDQFVNFALTATDAGLIALPTAGLEKRYPVEADINGLFKSATVDLIRQDGIVTLTVLGGLVDTTPQISRAFV